MEASERLAAAIDRISNKFNEGTGDMSEVARGLFAIASALDRLADAVSDAAGKPPIPPNY